MYMQKIVPHLWFNTEAKEAAQFYTTVFSDSNFPTSKINNISTIHNTPSGDCDIVSFELWGYKFMAISAGPFFKCNPSVSFMVNFDSSQDKDAAKQLDKVWEKLKTDGKVLMPLQKYPFSEHYGWIQDKYGISWQLILTNPTGEQRPVIIPSLLFTGDVCGRAEEASEYYLSVFKNAKRGQLARYGAGQETDKEGTLMFSDFQLEGQWFAVMDSARKHDFQFNEAISFIVHCDTQAEIDYYWEKLSANPASEQCGWLKDTFGVSWQIVPTAMDEMMSAKDPEKVARVTRAFLQMKKFDMAVLRRAYSGE